MSIKWRGDIIRKQTDEWETNGFDIYFDDDLLWNRITVKWECVKIFNFSSFYLIHQTKITE